MVLDEVTYLVATKATDEDYVSPVSLWGAIILISLAATPVAWALQMARREIPKRGRERTFVATERGAVLVAVCGFWSSAFPILPTTTISRHRNSNSCRQ
jgi:hypothetical protein